MASSQSFSMIQRRMLLSPWPASPVKSDDPLCTSAMRGCRALCRASSWRACWPGRASGRRSSEHGLSKVIELLCASFSLCP